jgi:hypothetical protein
MGYLIKEQVILLIVQQIQKMQVIGNITKNLSKYTIDIYNKYIKMKIKMEITLINFEYSY